MLTLEERVELIMLCGRDGWSMRQVAEEFNERHPNSRVSHTTVSRLLNKFKTTGSVHDASRSGRPSVPVEEKEVVIAKVMKSPKKSVRRSSHELNFPRTTMRRILKAENFHPYKLQHVQQLTEDDPDRRMEMCSWFMDRLDEGHEFLSDILFSDEAMFTMNGQVNRHNCRYYAQENPHWMEQDKHQGGSSVMVWCGIWRNFVIGPFFFDSTVTGESYLDMLKGSMIPQLESLGLGLPAWFQQDGAPAHYSVIVRHFLDDIFQDRWIGRRGPVEWAPRSPDLTPMDFFFWGYVKSLVYCEKIRDRAHLLQKISYACARISGDEDLFEKVRRNFRYRVTTCFELGGQHFEHL